MEPERHIEKLLRAYAKKRRAQAGDPLRLHPATRRLLQGEVARCAPRPDEEESPLTLWQLFRQQWAFLAGFVLVVFCAATLFFPALSKAKNKAQRITTLVNLKQIGEAAQMAAGENNGRLPASLDALTNLLGSDKILTDTESGRRFIYVAGGENLDDLPTNSVVAYSPTDKKGRAVLFADGRVEVINGARFSELTNRGLPQLAKAPAAPALAGGKAGASGVQHLFKNTAAPAQAAPVLANFQVQQNGNAIRVVDADGSVYDGSLLPESTVAQNEPAPVVAAMPAQVAPAQKIASRDESPTPQNYSFRVTGTNRTLNQNVVFAGNLQVTANATTNPLQLRDYSGAGGPLQSALTNQWLWPGLHIAGTAVIAGTNNIEINAVPLP